MTNEEKITFFEECADFLRKLSYLEDLRCEVKTGEISWNQIHLKTELCPSDNGICFLSFPDSIISYYLLESCIVVYRQKDRRRYYVEVEARFQFSTVTVEEVVETFLRAHPKLRKNALILLTEAYNDV